MTISKNSLRLRDILPPALSLLKNKPIRFFPFVIFGIFELIILVLIVLSPRVPFNVVFGPPIKTFFGETFLHYPNHFLLIPVLTSITRMWLSIFLGSLLTGLATLFVFNAYNNKHVRLGVSFNAALTRYIGLFVITFISIMLFYFSVKLLNSGLEKYFNAGHSKLLSLGPKIWFEKILICINLFLAVFIQAIFVYAIPFLMIDKEKLFSAINKSFGMCVKFFIPTVILIGVPTLLYVPILLLNHNAAYLVYKFFPEAVLIVSLVSILLINLIIDPLVIVSTTVLFLKYKESAGVK